MGPKNSIPCVGYDGQILEESQNSSNGTAGSARRAWARHRLVFGREQADPRLADLTIDTLNKDAVGCGDAGCLQYEFTPQSEILGFE